MSFCSSRPPPFRKPCGCGLVHDLASWKTLPYVGVLEVDEGEYAELRNCQCNSTLAAEAFAQ